MKSGGFLVDKKKVNLIDMTTANYGCLAGVRGRIDPMVCGERLAKRLRGAPSDVDLPLQELSADSLTYNHGDRLHK